MSFGDVAMILVASQLIQRSLAALRPHCEFSHWLTKTITDLSALCEGGEHSLLEPQLEGRALVPALPQCHASAAIQRFISNISPTWVPAVLAAEVIFSSRHLVQRFELKIVLVVEAAGLVGQTRLNPALVRCSAKRRTCGRIFCSLTGRVRANACVGELEETGSSQFCMN